MSEGRLVAIDIGSDTIHMIVMQWAGNHEEIGPPKRTFRADMVPPVGRP